MLKTMQVFRWWTTPKELRRIADWLEKAAGRTKLGEELPRTTVYGTEKDRENSVNAELEIILSQDQSE